MIKYSFSVLAIISAGYNIFAPLLKGIVIPLPTLRPRAIYANTYEIIKVHPPPELSFP